ncbi:MAG: AMP-binding protein [Alistipes sp.]|mgnify:CR=1 FL=1|nr:long-chain fatty acid--CoA ligase [Rikenellaceae bacterium]MBQ3149331.1 AMP-binding protein [Alistipes sp.]
MKALNTLYELLQNSIEKFSDKIAFSMLGGEDVTYAEFGKRVEEVQEMLLGAGLNAGDKVVILSSNMPNWGVSYFAITTAGMVAVPILPDFTGQELDKLIAHSEAKALLVSDKLFTKLSKETVASLNIVIRTKNLGIISQTVTEQGSKLLPKPEDLAVIIYTSGTTSQPKGVMHTHQSLVRQIQMIYGLYPIGPEDSMLSVLPLSHTYECSLGMLYVVATGASNTYLEKPPTASVLLPALRKVRPTAFLIVPLIIEKVYRSQIYSKFTSTAFWRALYNTAFTRRYLHRIAGKKLMKAFGGRARLFIGGAKLDEQVEQFLIDAKFPYAIGYGLTETAPLVAGQISPATKLGATGPAMNGLSVRLDNVNPETKQGEIVVKTPSALSGYYKNPEATAEAFTEDGWYRTGDLGYIDEDGYIFIKGRLKNMIVGPSGENIYPEEIESVLNTNAYVSESIVTEQDGQLVALVHFDTDAIEKLKDELMEKWEITRDEWNQKVDEWNARKEELKKDILKYVNSKVNRFSRISEVVEEENEFVKSPTSKIRRFLYNNRKKGNTSQPTEK